MIKTNELMLGNWVLHNDKPIKIDGVTENRIVSFANEIGVRLVLSIKVDEINPIPITEEILEKCGFDKHEISNSEKSYFYKNLYSNIQDDKIYEDFGKNGESLYRLVGVDRYFRYLHELQNVYFIYRKEQLKINF